MTNPIKTFGMTMAVSAAGLLSAAGIASANEGDRDNLIKCYDLAVCEGNACDGKDYMRMTRQECEEAGGSVDRPGNPNPGAQRDE